MRRISFYLALSLAAALLGCSDSEEQTVNPETAITPDFEDVVMAPAAPADQAPAVNAPPPPPGDAAPPPRQPASEEDLLAKMTPREKQEYEEKMAAINEAAELEKATSAVLLGDLQQAVEDYHFDTGKPPTSIGELMKGGYLQSVPPIPAGKKVHIDGKTLRVTLE